MRVVESVFWIVFGLVWFLFTAALFQQSHIRGTHWYAFRTAFPGHFVGELGLCAVVGVKSVQRGIRHLRQKKTPHV